jgi:hypothetical protein
VALKEATMERVWDYKRHAAECLLLAEQVADRVSREKHLAMAQAWSRLAELAERNVRGNMFRQQPPQQPALSH